MILKTAAGIEANVVQEIDISGKKYFLIDPGNSKYVGGLLTKFLVVPTSQFDKSNIIGDKAEVVE